MPGQVPLHLGLLITHRARASFVVANCSQEKIRGLGGRPPHMGARHRKPRRKAHDATIAVGISGIEFGSGNHGLG